jgi:hypothetical protein
MEGTATSIWGIENGGSSYVHGGIENGGSSYFRLQDRKWREQLLPSSGQKMEGAATSVFRIENGGELIAPKHRYLSTRRQILIITAAKKLKLDVRKAG